MSGSDSTYAANFGDGTSVLERVLLAIIDAHTTDEDEGCRVERLQAAVTALIGPARPNGQDLELALLFMARERQKDVCDYEMRALRSCSGVPTCAARTVPELANLAAREVMGCADVGEVQATASVLCGMFRQRCRGYEVEPNPFREAQEAEAVQRILSELAEWDVPARL